MQNPWISAKQAIFHATLSEIFHHGIHRAGISWIAKVANMSPSNIYNHFESKDHLLNELYLWIKQEEANTVFDWYDINKPIEERFFSIYRKMFAFYLQHQDYYNFLQQTFLINTISSDSVKKAYLSFDKLIDLFKEGQKLGIFFSWDSQLQMIMVWWVLSSVMKYSILWTIKLTSQQKEYVLMSMWEVVKK